MLSIRANTWISVLTLSLPLIRCLMLFLLSLSLFFWYIAADRVDLPTVSFILAVASLGASIASAFEAYRYFFGSTRTYLGFVANARTLAIARFRAPTLYIKRSEVTAVLEEGRALRLRDGSNLMLECFGVSEQRLEAEFRRPFYALWGNHRPVLAGALRVEENS